MSDMPQLHVVDDPEEMAELASSLIRLRAATAVAEHGVFAVAVSGGHTPRTTFARLGQTTRFPWADSLFFQVDERVVPRGDADRNLGLIQGSLPVTARIEPMPVDAADLEEACDRYAQTLPARFDLVHLGLGADGHVASLFPGDAVLDVEDRLVAITEREHAGRRRMTLTYPALNRAREVLWLVAGAEKRVALARLLSGDPEIPATSVDVDAAIIIADRAAVPE